MKEATRKIPENLRVVLDENWRQARHLENVRISFTNIYAVIVTGAFAFLGITDQTKHLYLLLFLFLFSIFGLMVILKASHEQKANLLAVKKILEEFSILDYMGMPSVYGKGKFIWKLVRVTNAFIGLYLCMIVLWGYLLMLG